MQVIHYHGTPITPREQLLRMAGRHFCVSYAESRDLETCLRIGQSVMLDNGAFSAFTRGAAFDERGFYKWAEPVLTHPHFAVVPDVIDGTVEQQRELSARWPFAKVFGAPVWHLSEPIERLLELVSDDWLRVCLGSTKTYWQIGSAAWCKRMDEAFNALTQSFGTLPWIHGLRMLGQAEGKWPLASADSTNVAQNFKRNTGCAECMANKVDRMQPAASWTIQATQSEMTL